MSVRAILIFVVWAAVGYLGIRGLNYVYEASRLMSDETSALTASPVSVPPSHK